MSGVEEGDGDFESPSGIFQMDVRRMVTDEQERAGADFARKSLGQLGQWLICDSVLQELTVAAFELFKPENTLDGFLERLAMRLSCAAVVVLDKRNSNATLDASAGLSRLSRTMPLDCHALEDGRYPWPEARRSDVFSWSLDLTEMCRWSGCERKWIVFFQSKDVPLTKIYKGLIERIVRIFCRAMMHRWMTSMVRDAMKQSQEQRQLLVDVGNSISNGLLFISEDGVVACNRMCQRLIGITAWGTPLDEAVDGMLEAIQSPPDLLERMSSLDKSGWETASSDEIEFEEAAVKSIDIVMKDGRELECFCIPVRGEDCRRFGTCWFFREKGGEGSLTREYLRALEKERFFQKVSRAAELRLSVLSEAGRILVASTEQEETVKNIVAMCVDKLADCAALDVLDVHGFQRIGMAAFRNGDDPLKTEFNRDIEFLSLNEEAGPGRALRTGTTEFMPTISPEQRDAFASDAIGRRRLEKLNPTSAIFVPLLARGHRFGVFSLVAFNGSKTFTEEDRSLAEELSRSVALALDNIRLLRQSQRTSEMRDDFLSVASHELRTPVTSLSLAVQGMRRVVDKNRERIGEGVMRLLEVPMTTAIRQSERMERFINRIMNLTSSNVRYLENGREDFSLSDLVRDLVQDMKPDFATAGCVPRLDLAPTNGNWDKGALEQIFTNLVTNALKFGGGKPVDIAVWPEGEWAFMSVKDYGIGIPDQDRARVFKRYERAVPARNYGGIGVGLSVVSELVEQMGGFIHLSSEEGKGTTFIIALSTKGKATDDVAITTMARDLGHGVNAGASPMLSRSLIPPAVLAAFDRGGRQT